MNLLSKYVKQTEFCSMEDFYRHYQVQAPDDFNFAFDVLDEYGLHAPNQRALVWCNQAGEERTFTFSQMMRYSMRTANFLRAQGIGKGDRVMLILKRHYEFWFCVTALHRLGAIVIPATHMLTTKDVAYRNNAACVKAIICAHDSGAAQAVDDSLPQCPHLQVRIMVGAQRPGWLDFHAGIEAADDTFFRADADEPAGGADPMLLFFTSGTTGMPKMVLHDFFYPLGHITTAKYWHGCMDGGLHLTISDTGWAKAMWGKLYGQWICGSALLVFDYERYVSAELAQIVQKYKVDTLCAPVTALRLLIKEDHSGYDFSSVQHCTVAGEPLNPEVYNRFLERYNLRIREGYGQSETAIIAGNFPWVQTRPGSMGMRSPAYEVVIVDENGDNVESGVVGELAIRLHGERHPWGMFQSYYQDPQRTSDAFDTGLYRTGDTAWMDEDGYFWYVGRTDDLIKSSGYRVGPFEVESALIEHPAVLECAVTGLPDAQRGQIVKATIVLAAGYTPCPALTKDLQEHVKRTTAPYKYPRRIDFVAELPKTASGKIQRNVIRDRDIAAMES